MSDSDYLTPAQVQPGMRVEIQPRPWVGEVTAALSPSGCFMAIEDGADPDILTSWSVDAIGAIRRLTSTLPTAPGTVIEATVPGGTRRRLARVANGYQWTALDGVTSSPSRLYYADEDLSDWTVLLPGEST